jgi:hypothetical protein
MASKKQRLRKNIIKVWKDNTGTTNQRDTDYNDLCNKYKVSEAQASLTWPKAHGDIIQ